MKIQLQIIEVTRAMGGALRKDQPVLRGQEVFLRPVVIQGIRQYQLLVGSYNVRLVTTGNSEELHFHRNNYVWTLLQADLMAVGAKLTLTLDPLVGVLEVYNAPIQIEEGVTVATLEGREIYSPPVVAD